MLCQSIRVEEYSSEVLSHQGWFRATHIHHFAGSIRKIYTTLQAVLEKYTPLWETSDFLYCFWMKRQLSLQIMEFQLGSAQIVHEITLQPRRASSINLSLSLCTGDAMFFIFAPCFLPLSCQCWLAHILYESLLCGVFRIYMTLKPWSLEVCFSSGHTHCKLPHTLIPKLYTHGTHHITMIYILHTVCDNITLTFRF